MGASSGQSQGPGTQSGCPMLVARAHVVRLTFATFLNSVTETALEVEQLGLEPALQCVIPVAQAAA